MIIAKTEKIIDSRRVPKPKKNTTVFERAFPIIYRSDDPTNMNYIVSANAQDQTHEYVEKRVKAFNKAMERLIELCTIGSYPLNVCGRRTNCCGCFMKSMFHENKQMGAVLMRSFMGR